MKVDYAHSEINCRQVVIGIDIGTTYIKGSVVDQIGLQHSQFRTKSISFSRRKWFDTTFASETFNKLVHLLQQLRESIVQGGQELSAIAIVGISPVLVLFEKDHPEVSYAVPYWHLPSLDGTSIGRGRSIRRVKALIELRQCRELDRPIVSDLIGYIVYRLTGNLTLNVITAGELGFLQRSTEKVGSSALEGLLNDLDLKLPQNFAGDYKFELAASGVRVPVCAGAPDSFGSALYARAVFAGQKVIYLGTFGSLLEVTEDFSKVFEMPRAVPILPYRWVLSVPGFGAAIESFARKYFPDKDAYLSLKKLEKSAVRSSPGANGVFFHLPSWDEVGRKHGEFGFALQCKSETGLPVEDMSRAVLEGLGHRLSASELLLDMHENDVIGVAGGGAQSDVWPQILSDVVGICLRVFNSAENAWGAACVAGMALNWVGELTQLAGEEKRYYPDIRAHELAQVTSAKSVDWYRDSEAPS